MIQVLLKNIYNPFIIIMDQYTLSDSLNNAFMNQTETDHNQSTFDINCLKFNPNSDSFVRLINLPKTRLSNISAFDLTSLIHQYIFSRDFGRITKSHRWNNPDHIIVGRNQPGNTQTDITINDQSVSFQHFMIYLRDGWNRRKKVTSEFVVFLSAAKEEGSRIGALNRDMLQLIWSYTKPKNQFLIQDVGSSLGTAIKIRDKCVMRQGMIFKILSNMQIKVIEIRSLKGEQLLTYMKQNSVEETIDLDQHYEIIKVEVMKKRYVFLNKNTKILIGRHESNDIVVEEGEISRRHCSIEYTGSDWVINDGVNGRTSINGIWRDLRTIDEAACKKSSALVKLQDNDEIMVGNTYFRFTLHNCQ